MVVETIIVVVENTEVVVADVAMAMVTTATITTPATITTIRDTMAGHVFEDLNPGTRVIQPAVKHLQNGY